LTNHGFDFADAAETFDFPTLIELDDRRDHGEERQIAISYSSNGLWRSSVLSAWGINSLLGR
jgi:uncharacterized DUF497 family protein